MGTILEVQDLKKYFRTPKGMLHAVDGINFKLEEGQTLGVVGESGCGKSTLGRTILHLLESDGGRIVFEGKDITRISHKALKETKKEMQLIFQDPFSSLNPRMSVSELIAEPLKLFKTGSKSEIDRKVSDLMEVVGLAERLSNSYPHELDGGRRQRIGIARALALDPKFIVCDEPVSALDVSIQAQILNLMQDLQEEKGLTYLFITHDLSVVKHISNQIMVMYLGNTVELADHEELFQHQYHPYTKALLSAIPLPVAGRKRKKILLKGEITMPIDPAPGCRFASRCPYACDECHREDPKLEEVCTGHFVACHKVKEINQL